MSPSVLSREGTTLTAGYGRVMTGLKADRYTSALDAALLAARARMALGSINAQDKTYLGTVDWLISRYGNSYGAAYLSQMESNK